MRNTFFIQQPDSLSINSNQSTVRTQKDSSHLLRSNNTAVRVATPAVQNTIVQPASPEEVPVTAVDSVKTDSVQVAVVPKEPEFNHFTLYPNYVHRINRVVIHQPDKLNSSLKHKSVEYTGPKAIFLGESGYKSWILILVLLCSVGLIVLRTNFQKYFDSVLNSLLNYQLAEKMHREKNVLIRRAFVLLNFNYFICCGLFFYLLVFRYEISFWGLNEFGKFFILLFVFFVLAQLRLLIIQLIGKIFDSTAVFKEYIHISFLINKNLGIYMLPLVFSAFFIEPALFDFVFYVTLIIIGISLVIKYIRSTQIIIKNKVFLFYSILYLCTFEILPILIGLKLVLSLR